MACCTKVIAVTNKNYRNVLVIVLLDTYLDRFVRRNVTKASISIDKSSACGLVYDLEFRSRIDPSRLYSLDVVRKKSHAVRVNAAEVCSHQDLRGD